MISFSGQWERNAMLGQGGVCGKEGNDVLNIRTSANL